MNHAITFELQFFLISILWGAILLLVYDILRIFRRIVKHDSFFVAVEDLIFWVLASLFIFAMMYQENNGIIRGFSVIGMAIGMVLYHYLFSELLVNYVTKLIKLIIRPISLALAKAKRFLIYLYSIVKKAVKFLFIRLKKWSKSVRIALNTRKQAIIRERKKHKDKKAFEKLILRKKKEEQKEAKKSETEKAKTKKERTKKEKTKKTEGITEDKETKEAMVTKEAKLIRVTKSIRGKTGS